MSIEWIIILLLVAFIGGLLTALHIANKRPIKTELHVHANAQAYGGAASTGVSEGPLGGGSIGGFVGSIFNMIKWLMGAAILAILALALLQKNTAAR